MTDRLSVQPSANTRSPNQPLNAFEPRVLDTPAAAAYCGTAASMLEKARLYGGGPPFIRITAKRVGYLREDLDRWLEAKARLTRTSRG